MPRAVHVVIAFILALAIPLQGIAAATMAACASEPATDSHAIAAQVGHEAMAEAGEHHAMHRHVHTSSRRGPDTASPSHAGLARLAKAKCSVCASCCAGAAMPSTLVVFDSVVLRESFAQAVPTGTPAFLTAGLERPPRNLLA